MKHIGADIRNVNLTRQEVVDNIKNFIELQKLIKVKDENNSEITVIRVEAPIDSYLKFWWHGTPQIIEWTLIKLNDGRLRFETRFGIQPEFRRWFWSVLIGLVALFYFIYKAGSYIGQKYYLVTFQSIASRFWLSEVFITDD